MDNGTLQLSQLRLVRLPLRGHGALHLLSSSGSCLSYLSTHIFPIFRFVLSFKPHFSLTSLCLIIQPTFSLFSLCISKVTAKWLDGLQETNFNDAPNIVPWWLDPCQIFASMTLYVERDCDIPNLQSTIAQIVKRDTSQSCPLGSSQKPTTYLLCNYFQRKGY